MKREIIFDTETTGLNPYYIKEDPRSMGPNYIIEIAGIEIIDMKKTGRVFHELIKPPISIPNEVVKIHGIDDKKVKNAKNFRIVGKKWIEFLGDNYTLVAHNAGFDMKFLDAEFKRNNYKVLNSKNVIDTLSLARKKHPGARASLDALCDRYGISREKRVYHGALLDSELLYDVYVELTGGKQKKLELKIEDKKTNNIIKNNNNISANFKHKKITLSDDEIKNHKKYVKNIKKAIWNME